MTWLVGAVLFWAAAWALNARLGGSGFGRGRAGRVVVPVLFGITILVLWEGIVRGLGVQAIILPPPSMIGAKIAGSLPTLWTDFVQTVIKGALSGFAIGTVAAFVAAIAIDRWRQLRGQSGALHTGHWLIDNRSPELGKLPPATGKASSTVVHFANLSDREIEDYVATGEPLKVAGAFTLDGLGGAFIDRIEGDPHTVIGLSLSVLRELTGRLQVHYSSLWQIAQGK